MDRKRKHTLGLDKEHQEKLLSAKKEKTDSKGSWKQGIDYLFSLYATAGEEGEAMQFSDAPLLAELWDLLTCLHGSLAPFFDGSLKTIREWSYEIKNLSEQFFSSSPPRDAFYALCDRLEGLGHYCGEGMFPFSSVQVWLTMLTDQQTSSFQPVGVEAVSFCSLLPMRVIPAKVICLLGMNEGAFPRQEKFFGLDKLREIPGRGGCPTQAEFDKQLFLEALLSAKEKMIMTALTHHALDQTPLSPSGVVLDLMNQLPEVCIFEHPHLSCDAAYFDGSVSKIKNFSKTDFESTSSACLGSEWPMSVSSPTAAPLSMDLSQLRNFLRNPLSRTFRKIYDLRLSSKRKLLEEEDFIVSTSIIENLLKNNEAVHLSEWQDTARLLPKFPSKGYFEDLALEKLKAPIHSLESLLGGESLLSVELLLFQKTLFQEKQKIYVPALDMQGAPSFFLRGQIKAVFSRGLLVGGKGAGRVFMSLFQIYSSVKLTPIYRRLLRPLLSYFAKKE